MAATQAEESMPFPHHLQLARCLFIFTLLLMAQEMALKVREERKNWTRRDEVRISLIRHHSWRTPGLKHLLRRRDPPDLGFKTRPENQYGRAPKRRVHQGGGCATWWNRVVLHKVLRCGCVRRRERGMAILVEGSKGRWQRG